MANLASRDFYDPAHPTLDTDRSPDVVRIFQHNFPELYQAVKERRIKTSTGEPLVLAGDTLITYKSAIKRMYGNWYGKLRIDLQETIRLSLLEFSWTPKKKILCWDGKDVVNNHQIGNMMPFPSSFPSINVLRASGGHFDYFDRFLQEVQGYYSQGSLFNPTSGLQKAICHQQGYFEFFGTYNNYIEDNLLQDFAEQDLWGITDFAEYVGRANEIIDKRSQRFVDSENPA